MEVNKEMKVFQGHTVIHSEAEPKIGAESTDLSPTVLAYSSFLVFNTVRFHME